MHQQRLLTDSVFRIFSIGLLSFPFTLYASFIESTMGTAVVNDATATYHNPAALTLLKKPQIIAMGSSAYFQGNFTGQSQQLTSGFTQAGSSKLLNHYFLPSIYVGVPTTHNVNIGIGVLSNKLNSDIDETSILRYAQSSNRIQDVDLIPALSLQLNEYLSVGAGLNYSSARFISNPIIGFPSLNLPDSQSHNVTSSNSYGGNAGFVIKPAAATLLGFNYRGAVSYQFSGKSYVEGAPAMTSNHYNFNFWTPARSVLTISHFITPDLGLIGTLQRVQWSIFKTVIFHDVATQVGGQSLILPTAVVPYYFHDTWIATLGGIKKITPKWVVRIAGSYDQSPGNKNYQLTNGDSFIIGASMGYEIYKNIIIDGSYAHSFIKNQTVNISSRSNALLGINKGFLDAASIKLTITV